MSSVDEVLGAPGQWVIDLHPDTPYAVRQRCEMPGAGYATLIITPTVCDHVALGWEGLHAVSIYAGMYRRRDENGDGGWRLTGPGLWAYLGNEEGVGPLVGAGLTGTKSYRSWVGDLDLDPFITRSSSLPNATSKTWTTDRVMTYREALEIVQELFGGIHPFAGLDLHIDHRVMEITTEPPVWGQFVAAPYDDGTIPFLVPGHFPPEPPSTLAVVIPGRFDVAEHVERHVSEAIVTGDSATSTIAIASPRHSYPGGAGDVRQEKYVNDGSIPAADTANVAAGEVERYEDPTVVVTFSTEYRDLPARVKPAATVLLCDPVRGIYDFSENPYTLGGRIFWPSLQWAESVRWPVRAGYGVFLRFDDDSILNLSEWFVPGDGAATVTFGEPMQTIVTGGVSERTIRRQM